MDAKSDDWDIVWDAIDGAPPSVGLLATLAARRGVRQALAPVAPLTDWGLLVEWCAGGVVEPEAVMGTDG